MNKIAKSPWGLGGIMKHITVILLTAFIVGCSSSPSGPDISDEQMNVAIEHLSTDYVDTEPPAPGMVATKVNILAFQIRAENFQPTAIEVYGRALIEGPPWNREHALYFRTDSLTMDYQINGYSFNTAQPIVPGSTYTFVRPKFPTNEYSPFEGVQGKVDSITITEIWAIDAQGFRISVPLDTLNIL